MELSLTTTVSYTQLYTHTGGVCGVVPDDHGESYSVIYTHTGGVRGPVPDDHGESYSVIYTYWGSMWSCP